jgi:hypothetical protein
MSISKPSGSATPKRPARARARGKEGGAKVGQVVPEARRVQARECLSQLEAISDRWLRQPDHVPMRLVLATYLATMRLGGAGSNVPCLMVVGGPSSGKTERVYVLNGLPGIITTSSPSGEAAFLSGTPNKERAENATGGLLGQIGQGPGIILIKDFTSILSKSDVERGKIIAAIRESADGSWTRSFGVDGGKSLTWEGRCGYIGACTDEIDRSHTSLAIMGQRFLFVRIPESAPVTTAKFKVQNYEYEEKIGIEMREAVHHCLKSELAEPHYLISENDIDRMANLATLLSYSRSAVHWDKWKREIEIIPIPESPPRVAVQMSRIWQAGGMLGLTESECWEMITRLAIDSMPYLRGIVLRLIGASPEPVRETDLVGKCGQPRTSCQRALSELAAHGLIQDNGAGRGRIKTWEPTATARDWITASGAMSTCPVIAPPSPPRTRTRESRGRRRGTDPESENNGMPEYSKDALDRTLIAETLDEIFEAQE